MSEDGEPAVNIGAEFGSVLDAQTAEGQGRAVEVINRLGEEYWRKSYGGQDAVSCLVRTILSQNTSDVASQPAFDALVDRFGEGGFATALANAPEREIATLIQPAGLYNQKASVIKNAAERIVEEYGSGEGFSAYVREEPREDVRETLLSFTGVGPKTADCVLLFAGGQEGVFPVDTHVHRIVRRLGLAAPGADHEEVRTVLESSLPPEVCGFGHTAMIQFGREYCSARRPACLADDQSCPLADCCDRVGIDDATETVIDPSETVDNCP